MLQVDPAPQFVQRRPGPVDTAVEAGPEAGLRWRRGAVQGWVDGERRVAELEYLARRASRQLGSRITAARLRGQVPTRRASLSKPTSQPTQPLKMRCDHLLSGCCSTCWCAAPSWRHSESSAHREQGPAARSRRRAGAGRRPSCARAASSSCCWRTPSFRSGLRLARPFGDAALPHAAVCPAATAPLHIAHAHRTFQSHIPCGADSSPVGP